MLVTVSSRPASGEHSPKVVVLFLVLKIKLECLFGVRGFAVVGGCYRRRGRPSQDPIAEINRCLRVADIRPADQAVNDFGQGIDNPLVDRFQSYGILQGSRLRSREASPPLLRGAGRRVHSESPLGKLCPRSSHKHKVGSLPTKPRGSPRLRPVGCDRQPGIAGGVRVLAGHR